MSANDRNQKRIDATEDDDFGDFEGPEDDAPECVQAMGGPPNWVFPDLLRVQSNQSSHEEPESILNNSSVTSSQSTRINDMRGATGRETGAIPKQRALDPPDVSLLTNSSQPKAPTTLDLCSSALRSNSYVRDSSAIPSVASTSPPSGSSPSNRNQNLMSDLKSTHNGGIDSNQLRINQLERDLKSMQTQKALLQQQLLQKDTQIREINAQSRQSVPNLIPNHTQDSAIAGLTETVEKFRIAIDSAMNRLEQRLTSLESRVSDTNLLSIGCDSMSSNSNTNNSENICQNLSPNLSSLLAQQRKQLEIERRRNLLLFSSVLRTAVETIETHLEVKDVNDVKLLDSNDE